MDGITAAKKIRARWPVAEQPIIIAITAYLLPDGRDKCIAAGMNDYIIKPVRMNELAELLRKHWPNGSDGKGALGRMEDS
jgi:CheY-like chemotaxis protein